MLHSKMLPGEQNAPFREQIAPPREQIAPLGEQNAPLGANCYAICYAGSNLLPGEQFAMEQFAPWGAKCYAIANCYIAKCSPGGAFCYREEQIAPLGAIGSFESNWLP